MKIKNIHSIQSLMETFMHKSLYHFTFLLLIAFFFNSKVLAAGTTISGVVKDAKTGEALIGANIVLMGTSMGASSDNNGKYLIPKVIPGTYTLKVSYIGYEESKAAINISEGENIKQDIKLEPVGIVGQEVVVTAQAYGQTQAINEQLSSNQISNVISSARIQELPDNTVAESVGRLPGVTVLRSGGEGNEVVVRGLAPKYNAILIDGVELSSSNPNDRSADLSMISSNMLDGIQVTKSVTPDMDAEVVGGTINFQLREAKVTESGKPQFNILTQGSYNNLSDAYHKFNNYKYVGSIEDRFFEDLFGVFVQFDVERKNLTSNEFGATYAPNGNDITQYLTTGLNLNYIPRDRQRYNLALVTDYKLPQGSLKFSNFFSSSAINIQNRSELYNITANQKIYGFASSNTTQNVITNSLDFDQQLPVFHMDAKFSHTYSENKAPGDWTTNFTQASAGLAQFSGAQNLNPRNVPLAANNNLSATYLSSFMSNSSFSRQRALSIQADFDADMNISDFITAKIKFGGKYRYQTRSYDYETFSGQGLSIGSGKVVDSMITNYFGFPSSLGTSIPISYFADPGYDYGKFLNGDYKMISPLNYGTLSLMANFLRKNADYIARTGGIIAYSHDNYLSTVNDYSGHENQSAFYVMSILNIGPMLTVIPGVRFQNLQTFYTGIRGRVNALPYNPYTHYDTTVTQTHGYWLPDLSIRYKPTTWCDIRLSYSNTIAYPDYNAIIPKIDVGFTTINYNNFQLTPSRSINYDVCVSFYENTIGLITVGGFLKQIKDLIFPWSFNVSGSAAVQKYYPPQYVAPNGTFIVNTFVNDSYKINDYGAELDWQTHFWYLPGPLSGLIFNANYTHIFSKAEYPFTSKRPGRSQVYFDTSYTDRLLFQPDDMINLALGFDYGGFSARLSMLYSTNIFTGSNYWPQLRANTAAYRRWDLAVKQELPWFGIQVYGNLNNINGAKDVSVIQASTGVPTSQQDYGMTADFGIRLKL